MTTMFPEVPSEELLKRARAHYTPNYRQAPLFLVRGEGVWVWDRDGNRYLDLIAGIAVCSLGHAHPRLVMAIQDQADKLVHVSSLFHNEPALALMDELIDRSFADRVFFSNSGAEANEAALKLARRYWSVVRKKPERFGVLAFHDSFHGRTFGTLSATGQSKYHQGFEPLLDGFHFATFGELKSVSKTLDEAHDTIGTVIIEPIQCEGGLNLPPKGFLRDLRKLCDERDLILIFDEVQTGVGRTAEWFCYEIEPVLPDIMTLAKGLAGGVPLGATLASEKVAGGFEPGTHASTFGGNPLATRAGLEVIRTIADEGLLDHVYEMGQLLGKGLKRLVKNHSERCVGARGLGLLRGLELTDESELLGKVIEGCRQQGLLVNGIAGKVVRITPPLIIQRGQVKLALEVLDQVLSSV